MSDYGELTAPGSLEFRRLFKVSPERLWDYLVDPDLRATWFCGGATDNRVGGRIELAFDHTRLSDLPPPNEHQADSQTRFSGEILEYDPPRRLAFTWPEMPSVGGTKVTITLIPKPDDMVELHLVHDGLSTDEYRDGAAAGWHTHFDLLDDIFSDRERRDFWKRHEEVRSEYDARFG